MAKISIYLNDYSSKNNSKQWIYDLSRVFFRHDLKFVKTKTLEELSSAAKIDIKEGVEFVFIVGGDGTTHLVLQEFVGTDVTILAIPAGTANDLACNLGIERSVSMLFTIFAYESIKEIDLLKIGERYIATNAGIGLVSEIADRINRYRKNKLFLKLMTVMGSPVYPLILGWYLICGNWPKMRLKISSDDLLKNEMEIETPLLLINNQPVLGNKFNIAPNTKNDDGKFNVTLLLHKKKWAFIRCAIQILRGHFPKDDKELLLFETNNLKIESADKKELLLLCDGEVYAQTLPFEISIKPRSLKLFYVKPDKSVYHHSYSLEQVPLISNNSDE